jgi:protein XRP2
MFNQLNGVTCVKKPGDIDGIQFAIRYLDGCDASLYDWTSQVMVDQCKNSKLMIGPCQGSVFFRDCENCTIYVACQQFRCRDLKNCTIYLYAANDPVIEASENLKFGPFNISYPLLAEHAQKA